MNLEQIRKDTRHCHNKLFINSAGASLMPRIVVEKTQEYFLEEENVGGYKVAALRSTEIAELYSEIGKLINCKPENVAFTPNATDAYSRALSSIPFEAGDVILTTDDDYVSNHIGFLSLEKRFGIRVVMVKNKENGDLDMIDFEDQIKKYNPKLVAVTHVPTNSGLIQAAAEVGELCQKYDVIYLLDACQSVGQINVDVQQIKCDFLSVTGRKFLRGPRGTGFLYVSDKILSSEIAPLFLDLQGATWTAVDKFKVHDTAKRFEIWEQPYPFVIGLMEAVKYANQIGIEQIEKYNKQLLQRLTGNLAAIDGVEQYDIGSNRCNIVTFRKSGVSKDQMIEFLDSHHVYYSLSAVDNARIDFEKKGIDWAIRFSPHYFNTLDEMDKVSEIVDKI